MRKFQDVTRAVLTKEKEAENMKQTRSGVGAVGGGFTNLDDEYPVRFSNDQIRTNDYGEQRQSQMERQELEAVKERKKQFNQLESDIQDLNSMFKDLAVMVHDQGQDIG